MYRWLGFALLLICYAQLSSATCATDVRVLVLSFPNSIPDLMFVSLSPANGLRQRLPMSHQPELCTELLLQPAVPHPDVRSGVSNPCSALQLPHQLHPVL
jgi:hypothetical protein